MADMSAVGEISVSLNAAMNILKALKDLRDWELISVKLFELNELLLAALDKGFAVQEEKAALIKRIRALEYENAGLRSWEREKEEFELRELAPGMVAYATKSTLQPLEPVVYLCAHCFQGRQKSILQRENLPFWLLHVYKCPQCKNELWPLGRPMP